MTKEELEKEVDEYFKSICGDYNEEYERTGKRHYWVGFDIKNAYLAGAEPRERRIAELEKENAELKKQLGMSNKVYNDNLDYSHHIEGQLTKAKDLLLRFVELKNKPCASGHSINMLLYENICAEAEQFLNEVEK